MKNIYNFKIIFNSHKLKRFLKTIFFKKVQSIDFFDFLWQVIICLNIHHIMRKKKVLCYPNTSNIQTFGVVHLHFLYCIVVLL